ncbi:MAG: radical SAM protein [Candidatus Bathyarchaeota archaeon]|nr:radical SAM protein [Candidatus Bathyarchaeota archaeon]
MVNATQKCNLNCSYCFVDKGRFSYNDQRCEALSPQTAKHLVEELPRKLPWAKHFCIHFYGGEPMLNLKAIDQAIDAASQSGVEFSFAVTTNGTVATKKAMTTLKRGNFNVVLSIDGPSHIHNECRKTKHGEPTHAKVLEFLQKAKSEGLHVRGSSVVRRGWSLKEACAYLDTLPVDAVKAQAVRLPPENPLSLGESERSDYFSHLQQIGQEAIDSIKNGKVPRDDRFNHRVLQLLCKMSRDSFCGAGTRTFGMSSDGTMLPCVLLAGKQETALGNIGDGGEWAKNGVTWAKKHKPRRECFECWALPLCGGGCPAMLSVCGDDECELVRMNCEVALQIYAAFLDHPQDLLVLSEVLENNDS